MDRNIIGELKDIRDILQGIHDSPLISQELFFKVKRKLRALIGNENVGNYHSSLSGILNTHLPDTERALEEFKRLLNNPVLQELGHIIREAEEKFPKKMGF